jgi:sugar phosphate isomerase/epimerase
MTNRRDFLRNAALLMAGGMLIRPGTAGAALPAKGKKAIGLQLYSLRDAMRADAKATLQEVAKIGFKTLETANYTNGKIYGMAPAEFKKYVKDLGMKVTGAHLGGTQYTKEKHAEAMEWWKKAIEDHKAAGITWVIKPSMPIPTTLSDLQVWCDYYNAVGAEVKKSGMRFGFHNHAREFEKIEGEIMFDYMINNTDPKLVVFELDVYWVMKGGYNAVDYMKKYPARIPVLHIKDEHEIGASGTIDFKPIFETAYANKVKEFYVEVERYNFEPIESVRKSYEYLAAAPYVK